MMNSTCSFSPLPDSEVGHRELGGRASKVPTFGHTAPSWVSPGPFVFSYPINIQTNQTPKVLQPSEALELCAKKPSVCCVMVAQTLRSEGCLCPAF